MALTKTPADLTATVDDSVGYPTVTLLWHRRANGRSYRDGITLQGGRYFLKLGSCESGSCETGTLAEVAGAAAEFERLGGLLAAHGQPNPNYGGKAIDLTAEQVAPLAATLAAAGLFRLSEELPPQVPAYSTALGEHLGRLDSGN